MFGIKALKAEIGDLNYKLEHKQMEVNMLIARMDALAKMRSRASKQGWITRRKEQA